MLCASCTQVFAFAATDHILCWKENAIQQAVEYKLDATQIKTLQRECARYQNALKSRRKKSLFPSPWNTTEPIDARFAMGESYSVWHLEKRRHWHELKRSAASNGCGLCERLGAMIHSQITTPVSESATITCVWFLEGGSLTPEWLRFDLNDDHSQSLFMMRFHIAIRPATSEFFWNYTFEN